MSLASLTYNPSFSPPLLSDSTLARTPLINNVTYCKTETQATPNSPQIIEICLQINIGHQVVFARNAFSLMFNLNNLTFSTRFLFSNWCCFGTDFSTFVQVDPLLSTTPQVQPLLQQQLFTPINTAVTTLWPPNYSLKEYTAEHLTPL